MQVENKYQIIKQINHRVFLTWKSKLEKTIKE